MENGKELDEDLLDDQNEVKDDTLTKGWKSILFCNFDLIVGPTIVYQYPEGYFRNLFIVKLKVYSKTICCQKSRRI